VYQPFTFLLRFKSYNFATRAILSKLSGSADASDRDLLGMTDAVGTHCVAFGPLNGWHDFIVGLKRRCG